jgi:hypothetical protein
MQGLTLRSFSSTLRSSIRRRFAALEYQQVNEWQQRDATAD